MDPKKTNKEKLQTKLLHKYRLVVLNEDTFEERFAVKLTLLNVFFLSSLAAIVLITLTTLLIVLTPIKEYIPGYSSAVLQKQALRLSYKTDSLLKAINMNDLYIKSIKSALSGEVSSVVINKDSIYKAAQVDTDVFELLPSSADSTLREKVSREDKYNFFETAISAKDFLFFTPVNGPLSAGFDSKEKHFAVDIVTPVNTPVKSTSDGRVIFTSWTTEAGYVIIIDHGNELISVYKHNSSLTKTQGEIVKSREVIAISGGSGELSSGPHLHFELWSNGVPLNPANFIDF